jgi:hypothetical protein
MRWDHCDDRHPNPYYDPSLERIQEEEHCGFSSLEALNDWFEHYWRVQLFVNDFRIYVYENDPADVRVGEYGQALFNRNRAVLLHTIEITD